MCGENAGMIMPYDIFEERKALPRQLFIFVEVDPTIHQRIHLKNDIQKRFHEVQGVRSFTVQKPDR